MRVRLSFSFACVVVLTTCATSFAQAANQAIVCGDCNYDGAVSILDALVASQIGLGLVASTAIQREACDVQVTTSGEAEILDVLDVLLIAQAATSETAFARCGVVDTVKSPSSTIFSRLYAPDFDVANPNFGAPGGTAFFDVEFTSSTSEIQLRVQNQASGSDANLYLGLPGTLPGSRNAADYYFKSTISGSGIDLIGLACSALFAQGGHLAVAVHAVVPGQFTLSATPGPEVCTSGGASELATTANVAAGSLGSYGDADFWQISSLPANASEVVVTLSGPSPASLADYDLMIGVPGTAGGDSSMWNYHGTYPYGAGGWGDPFASEVYVFSREELNYYLNRQIAIGVIVRTPSRTTGSYTLRLEVH